MCLTFLTPVNTRQHHEAPDIELPALVQKRAVDVLLQDVRPLPLVVRERVLDRIEVGANGDPAAAVGVLPRLDYPDVALVLALSACDYPSLILGLLKLNTLILLLVITKELFELQILGTRLDVKRQRDVFEDILTIVLRQRPEIQVELLFVREIGIPVETIRQPELTRVIDNLEVVLLEK